MLCIIAAEMILYALIPIGRLHSLPLYKNGQRSLQSMHNTLSSEDVVAMEGVHENKGILGRICSSWGEFIVRPNLDVIYRNVGS